MGFSRQEYWSGVPLPSPFDALMKHLKKLKGCWGETVITPKGLKLEAGVRWEESGKVLNCLRACRGFPLSPSKVTPS